MTTAQLADIIGHGDWYALIPGLCDEDARTHLMARVMLHTENLELADIWACATELGGRLAGTGSWWAATRLLGHALADWTLFDGWCIKHGYDPLAGPLWRICSAVYEMLREQRVVSGKPDATRTAWEQLHRDIYDPPASAPRSVPMWTPDDEAAAFRKSMAAIGATGG